MMDYNQFRERQFKEQGYVEISEYEGLYLINKKGKIYSKRKGRLLKVQKGGRYSYVALVSSTGVRKSEFLHRLLAKTFIPNPSGKPFVNHIDGNKKNNSLSNLEWCTAKENTLHAISSGLSLCKGADNNMSYFSDWDIKFIRHWHSRGYRICEIALAFCSTHSCISDIVKRRTWSHI